MSNFSSNLPRFYDDIAPSNPDQLDFLAGKVLLSHIIMASDYPFAENSKDDAARRTHLGFARN